MVELSTDNNGSSVYIQKIIDAALLTAQDARINAAAMTSAAYANASAWTAIGRDTGHIKLDAMPLDMPSDDLGNIVKSYSNSKSKEILELLLLEWQTFVDKYYKDDTNQYVDAWIKTALTEGGTGIPPEAEDAIWNRGRDRMQEQADQDIVTRIEMHARLGWIIPTGSLTDQIYYITDEKQKKACELNRDILIHASELEQKNVHLAVSEGNKQRDSVLNAASNFISVLLGAYSPANVYGGNIGSATKEFYLNSVAYEAEFLKYSDLEERILVNENNEGITIDKSNQDAEMQSIDAMTRAAMAGAVNMSNIAAAALSSQNTMAALESQEIV